MSTTSPIAAPSIADLIPAAELARAARLAFDTLVSIMSDAKATLNERRIAAMAVLRLAAPKRAPHANSGCTQPREPVTPAPLAPPSIAIHTSPPLARHPTHAPDRATRLLDLVGTAAPATTNRATAPRRPVTVTPSA